MKFRLYVLLFSATVFILTTIALAIVYTGTLILRFWLIFAYVFACPLVFAFAVDFLIGDGKLSGKSFCCLTFGVIILSTMVTHSVWTIITPKWSFSVTTDKATYRLGEDVMITACLRNTGFITRSFQSKVNNPVLIGIAHQYPYGLQVWYTLYHINTTLFLVRPNESLERHFIWDQTNIHFPEREIEPGIYYIRALVPSAESTMPVSVDPLFEAWTSINVTSI